MKSLKSEVAISKEIDDISFAEVFDRVDIETAFDSFYEVINRLISENVPVIHIKKKEMRQNVHEET